MIRKPMRVNNVIRELSVDEFNNYSINNRTKHFSDERIVRFTIYSGMGLVDGEILFGFEVDKDHPNGNEIHLINDKAIIFVFNANTKLLINVLGARSGQIYRYWADLYGETLRTLSFDAKQLYYLAKDRECGLNPIHNI